MDPWGVFSSTSRDQSGGDTLDQSERGKDTFSDNFCDKSDQITFERLPDSQEYLALLESKLQKINSSNTKQKQVEESRKIRQTLVQDLAKVREDTLANLVTSCDNYNAINSEADIDLDQNIAINPVIRRLVPEQPLTVGEQVVLTQADQLEKQSSESETNNTESL